MRRPYVFWSVVAVGAALFFAWGLKTPDLEKVWRLELELRLGLRDHLERRDVKLLQRTLDRYPELAKTAEDQPAGLLSQHRDGRVDQEHAYLVRTKADQVRLRVRYAYPRQQARVEVRARSQGGESEGLVSPEAPFVWSLPAYGGSPELIELQLVERSKKGRARRALVRVDWLPAGDGP